MNNENLALALAEVESYNGQGGGKRSGGKLRYYCPIHGGDRQRSFEVNPDTGHFKCHACGAWGYLVEARERRREEWASMNRGAARARPAPPPYRPRKVQEPPARPELLDTLKELQKALPGSWGEKYLSRRGIPLDVARAAGVGYAGPGKWAGRDWRWGRVVFAHASPAGELVNLYGRAVGSNEKVPKEKRHDHLPGAKGYFNARALVEGQGPLYVCEGAFDALALMAAGQVRTVAIFGVDGWRWEWAREIREIILCLDTDEAGQAAREELARQAAMRGKRVAYLPPEALGGHKDLSDAWAAGVLQLAPSESISGIWPGPAEYNILGEVAAWPAAWRETWEERAAIMEAEGKMTRPEAERAAFEILRNRVGA
jgi:hypothetical protein